MPVITKLSFIPAAGGVRVRIETGPPAVHRSAAAALAAWINAAGIKLKSTGGPVLDAAGNVDPGASLPDIIQALNAAGIRAAIDAAGAVTVIY